MTTRTTGMSIFKTLSLPLPACQMPAATSATTNVYECGMISWMRVYRSRKTVYPKAARNAPSAWCSTVTSIIHCCCNNAMSLCRSSTLMQAMHAQGLKQLEEFGAAKDHANQHHSWCKVGTCKPLGTSDPALPHFLTKAGSCLSAPGAGSCQPLACVASKSVHRVSSPIYHSVL